MFQLIPYLYFSHKFFIINEIKNDLIQNNSQDIRIFFYIKYNNEEIFEFNYSYTIELYNQFPFTFISNIRDLLWKKTKRINEYYPNLLLKYNLSLNELNKTVIFFISFSKYANTLKVNTIEFFTYFINFFCKYFSNNNEILEMLENLKNKPELYNNQDISENTEFDLKTYKIDLYKDYKNELENNPLLEKETDQFVYFNFKNELKIPISINYAIKLISFLNSNKIDKFNNFFSIYNSFLNIHDNKPVDVFLSLFLDNIHIKFKYELVRNLAIIPYKDFFTGIVKGFENYLEFMYKFFPQDDYIYKLCEEKLESIKSISKDYIRFDCKQK